MSSSLDQALGDIISANRSKGGNRRGGRGGGGGGGDRKEGGGSGPIRRGGNRRDERRENRNDQYSRPAGRSDGAWQRDLGSSHQQQSVQRSIIVGDTVRLSNLDSKINEEDLRFMFEKIGTLSNISIHYTSTGQCTGTAEVRFTSNEAAAEAVSQLDQAEVDGRIMYVQLVGHVMQASHPSVKRRDDRRDNNNAPRSSGDRDRSRSGRQQGGNRDGNRRQERQQGEGNKGQGGKRGGRGGRSERPAASMEDLDAELNSYHEARAASSATSDAPAAASSSEAAPAAE